MKTPTSQSERKLKLKKLTLKKEIGYPSKQKRKQNMDHMTTACE